MLVVIVIGIVSAIVSGIISFALGGGGSSESLRNVQLVLDVALGLITTPIVPVMLTVLYFDLRVRRDRLELLLAPQS